MLEGEYLRRKPNGKFSQEQMTLPYFLERVAIDFQFSREGDYILNLQGGSLLGVFVPSSSIISEVISSLEDNYSFIVELN